ADGRHAPPHPTSGRLTQPRRTWRSRRFDLARAGPASGGRRSRAHAARFGLRRIRGSWFEPFARYWLERKCIDGTSDALERDAADASGDRVSPRGDAPLMAPSPRL